MRTRSFNRFFSGSAALAAAVTGIAACGGIAIVDQADDDGDTVTAASSGAGGGSTTSSAGVGGEGAGTSSSSSSGSGPHDAVCMTFCAEAEPVGCPKGGDCMQRCLGAFVNGCDAEVEAMLACTPKLLNENCQIHYPDDDNTCHDIIAFDLNPCFLTSFDAKCDSSEGMALEGGACSGTASCDIGQLSMNCDGQGTCSCFVDGELLGTCQSFLNGAEFCFPWASCCTPLILE
jgi:hypothetical protein